MEIKEIRGDQGSSPRTSAHLAHHFATRVPATIRPRQGGSARIRPYSFDHLCIIAWERQSHRVRSREIQGRSSHGHRRILSRKTWQRHSEERPRRALRNVWAPWGASMRREHGHARARTFRSVSLPGVATEVRTYTQYSRAVATSVGAGVGMGAVVGAGTGTGGGAGAVPAEGGGGASAAEGVSSSRSNANHELLTEGNSTFTSPWESTRRTRPTVEWSTPSGQAHRGRCGHNKGGKWRTRVSEARARHEARE